MSDLSYTHEEADTRLLFHASHSFHHVYTKLMIRVRPVLHTRRSGHTAPVPCLPFVPSWIYQADYTCQTCPTHTRRSGHMVPVPSLPFVPSCIYQVDDTCNIIYYTDVVILAIFMSNVLQDCEILVAFGRGSKLRFIPSPNCGKTM